MRLALVLLLAATACDSRRAPTVPQEGQAARGLAPTFTASGAHAPEVPAGHTHGDMANPHGDMAVNPHGDMANPHGDMANAHGDMANPHGDVADELDRPNPHTGLTARPADPAQAVAGRIELAPALRQRAQPGDAIFLTVYPLTADGQRSSRILAVERVDLAADHTAAFRITAEHALDAAAAFSGPVEVVARIDRDGEVRSREHGDLEGAIRAKIPQTDVLVRVADVVK